MFHKYLMKIFTGNQTSCSLEILQAWFPHRFLKKQVTRALGSSGHILNVYSTPQSAKCAIALCLKCLHLDGKYFMV